MSGSSTTSSVYVRILLILGLTVMASRAASADDRAARLLDIVQPYTDDARAAAHKAPLRYGAGVVGRNGAVPDQLDCSSFASPVIHRYLGREWTAFDQTIQQSYGDGIASAYHMTIARIESSVADHLKLLAKGGLIPGVYFFDLRNAPSLLEPKGSGAHGHTGFLIVEGTAKNQKVTQIHLSGTRAATGRQGGGLAVDSKRWKAFVEASIYGNGETTQKSSKVFLYILPSSG